MRPRRCLAALALLALAGCSGGAATTGTGQGGTGSSVSASAGASSVPPSATPQAGSASPDATGSPAGATPSGAPVLVLAADGLGVQVGEASIRRLSFPDAPAARVRAAVTAALGPLTVAELPECGQGPRSGASRQRFSLLFDGDRFVGWTDEGAAGRRLTTADGIGVGSTLADLRRSLGAVDVAPGSLGTEWTAPGGLSGVLDGGRPTSKVTVISAGETCFFR